MKSNNDEAHSNIDELDQIDDLDLGSLEFDAEGRGNQASDVADQTIAEAVPADQNTPAQTSAHVPVATAVEASDPLASDVASALLGHKSASRTRNRSRKSEPSAATDDDLDDAIINSAAYRRALARRTEAETEMQRTIAKLRAADPRNRERRLKILGSAVEETFKKNPTHWAELMSSIEDSITEPRDRQLFEELVKLDSERARQTTMPAIGRGIKVRVQERPEDRPRHLKAPQRSGVKKAA